MSIEFLADPIMTRVAVFDVEKCKPNRCGRVCYRFCPMVRSRIEAIVFKNDKAVIVESLCSGCGICVKKCPFKSLSIVNLPDELEKECTHRFGENSFKLFRLPIPSPGLVLGLLGQNGTGKTTTLRIFSGEIKLNLGKYWEPLDWKEIYNFFKGSTLQSYFQKMGEGKLRVSHKPQYVDKVPKVASGRVGELLERVDERKKLGELTEQLALRQLWNRDIQVLSGGELQRMTIAAVMSREADIYIFDEPSSYLDVKQRIAVAKAIRSLKDDEKTIIISEHDLAIMDYLSDRICIFYGAPGVYGIVSNVHSTRAGINIYMQGYIPDENIRFRPDSIILHEKPPTLSLGVGETCLKWGKIEKTYEGFKLVSHPGEIKRGEIIGIFGPNGIGKTTFIKIIAGIEEADKRNKFDKLEVSYKPQYISAEYESTVKDLLMNVAKENFTSSYYKTEILQPLKITPLLDRNISELSGGELQKVAIASCLSRTVELYLFDEPSAYLDVEERLNMARAIRRVVEKNNVTAFVVEHDVVAQDFLADRLMVFTGNPGLKGVANPPLSLRNGMNLFLKDMGITFRRDPTTKRPRVNKEGSKLDKLQKQVGEYYYIRPGG